MENLQKIAMLIDADNTQLAKLESVIQEVNTLGRIVVKRAYGNWKKDALKRWEGEIKRLAIKPEQQFHPPAGAGRARGGRRGEEDPRGLPQELR